MVNKIIIGAMIILFLLPVYGYISWNIYMTPTFFTIKERDCMPKTISTEEYERKAEDDKRYDYKDTFGIIYTCESN